MIFVVTVVVSAIVITLIIVRENKKAAALAKEREERYNNAMEYFNKRGFRKSRSYGDLLIDEKNEKFAFIGYLQIFSFSSLLKYEIRQGDQIIKTSGSINGISSGTKIGVLGVSASTSSVNTVSKVSHLPPSVIIYTKISSHPKIDIQCSSENEADRYGALLEFILSENKKPVTKPVPKPAPVQSASNVDELLKLKSLLDCGAITQEEFNSEKAKILSK